MNVFIATGNIGRDCEIRATPSGTTVAVFPLAVTHGYGDRKGTMWVRCNIWGKRAEGGLPQYLTKGAQVAVSGELSVHEWDKQDGTKGYSVEMNVDNLDLIGGKSQQAQKPPQQSQPQKQPATDFDDDIPF